MAKVLHILTTLDPKAGGVSQAVRSIIGGLQPHGIINEAVTVEDPAADHGDSFTCYRLGTGKTKWSYNPALTKWLKLNLRNYDVAILHGMWQHSSLALRQALASAPQTRVYVMPHGMLDPYFQKAGHRRIKALRNKLLWELVEKRIIAGTTGMLFTCKMEMALAAETFPGYKPGEQLVTGLPVDQPPAIDPRMKEAISKRWPGVGDKPYWLFLGRIDDKKGVDLLVNAYLRLEKESTLPALVIAGPGADTAFGQALISQAAQSGNIFFPGMLSGDAKWGAFYETELFILPSHQENFGIAVAEALACGRPVLITDKINIYEEIRDGGAAIVKSDVEDDILDGLRQWLSVPSIYRNEMSSNALSVFSSNYESREQIRKFISLLRLN